jgi:diguanylate cyclase (GGDEF)-like protein
MNLPPLAEVFRSLHDRGRTASVIERVAVVVLPVALGLLTLVAVLFWQDRYPDDTATAMPIRVVEATSADESAAAALARLANVRTAAHTDTRLSTQPFWLLVAVPEIGAEGKTLALSSRHARQYVCWDVRALDRPFAVSTRAQQDESLRLSKSGFALPLAALPAGAREVLCEGRFAGPARIRAELWDNAALAAAEAGFYRSSGLLEGGILVLAAFVFLVALINREWLYVLFAGWLVANFQLAAISAGFDWAWLGRAVPEGWILPMRKGWIATYCVLTIGLLGKLFAADLAQLRSRWLLVPVQWSGALVFLAALAPFEVFLPIMWSCVVVGVAVIGFLLACILRKTRSPVALWYGASLAVTLGSGFYEVVAAAFSLKVFIGSINSVTAALASSLLSALAVAAQFRSEREQRLAAQAESQRASSKLEATYKAIPIGLFTANASGDLLQVNPAFRALVDAPGSSALAWSALFPEYDWHLVVASATVGTARELEVRRGPSGEGARWFIVHATRSGEVIEGSLQDVTERKTASDRLRFLADHDPLTGMLNRRGIELAFKRMRRQRTPRPSALAYLDLDRFKLINDLYGHPAGDEVLRQLCERVRSHLADDEAFARVGGDEFVLLFENCPIVRARALCGALVEAIEREPFSIGDKAFQLKGSIGLIELDSQLSFRDAVATADRACREAKAGGRGHVVTYEQSAAPFHERLEELRLIARLGQGAEADSLFLEMQPILSIDRPQESLNFEVLLRMRDESGKTIPPGKVISAAENNGRMATIDRWVLEQTLSWIDVNRTRFNATHFVCVNLSGSSLNDERFIEDAFAMLSSHPRSAPLLCLEITESVALHDLHNTGRFIDRAKTLGAKIALDDFGAGYSSFSYLRDLPADAVKIDGGFVRGVSAHPANVAILQAIIELSHNLGMKTVAEWVEDLETLELLAELGADYAQGFVIARSQPAEAMLVARSSADFITDEAVRRFVGQRRTPRREAPALPLAFGSRGRRAGGAA